MATTRTTARTTTTGTAHLNASIVKITDIDARIIGLERECGLTRGSLGMDVKLQTAVGNITNWSMTLYLNGTDGLKNIATSEGRRFDVVLNRVFKDAWRVMRSEYGGTRSASNLRRAV